MKMTQYKVLRDCFGKIPNEGIGDKFVKFQRKGQSGLVG